MDKQKGVHMSTTSVVSVSTYSFRLKQVGTMGIRTQVAYILEGCIVTITLPDQIGGTTSGSLGKEPSLGGGGGVEWSHD